ncbi:MAG: 3-hydroxyacyl-CoA dehydrogenase NAD-binding domain-containing protein [Bacteroidetes bacterium]|nr:3-hydroxyacyl-CoA dehydrogenase NAD-binding domain-containing protein [Bacteroidota bacterium]MDA1119703.1 3-hydroxyacyl-CoA dehydrogenase NAD-binding domain-containing protein [Bacteroidota bacterium]
MASLNPLTLEKHENIAIIWIDTPGEEWNKITRETEKYFEEVTTKVVADPEIIAAIVISRKKGFIAGADIEEFLDMKPGEAAESALSGHVMLNKIEDSKKPYVAAIHGPCMGGGLEISLACAGRVVSNHTSTLMALPEVKLGLLPGLGGTKRLPKTIGIQKALDVILTGRNIFPYQAYKMGLADEIVDQTILLRAAKKLALKIANGSYRRTDKRSLLEKILECNPITRNIIFKKAGKIAAARTYDNYPAVPKIIQSIKFGLSKERYESSRFETTSFDELLQSSEASELINIFFGMTALKKNPLKSKAKEVKTIGVLGSGLMGLGISEVSLSAGFEVLIKDIDDGMLSKAKSALWVSLAKRVRYKSIVKAEAERLINQVSTTTKYDLIKKADVVIEAVFEDLDLKHKVLQEVEGHLPDNCVFASNTSSLPITKIASKSKRPENVIGMHYFSPVPKMPLLEIIVTPMTADWVKATALEVGVRQGKVCIVVNDGPGFYTTRILSPYLNEALLLLEEGGDILQIDRAMKKFGFPVGPFTLMDEVGLDVGAHISRGDLGKMFAGRGGKASDLIQTLTDNGFNGRKNRNGFLAYDKTGKKIKGKINPAISNYLNKNVGSMKIPEEEIQQRLALMMINEAAYCLQEDIIQSPRDGDIGAVFGLGFPPFRGGPFRYLDHEGVESVVKRMDLLQKANGDRFIPADILKQSTNGFY